MHKVPKPLGLIWSELWVDPLFRLGILIKFCLIVLLLPIIQFEWFG